MRTYGETKNCAGCRYWSEMIAMAHGGGPTKAMCLADSGPRSGQYTTGGVTCSSWASGHLGAIDDPPGGTAELYAREEGGRS